MFFKLVVGLLSGGGVVGGWGMSSSGERYNLYSQGSTGWSTLRYEEFQEEDVWGVVRQTKEFNSISSDDFNHSTRTLITTSRQLSTAARMIPKSSNTSSSCSMNEPKMIQHSAPVNIPDWNKIYGKKASNYTTWIDHDHHNNEDDRVGSDNNDGVIMNTIWDSEVEDEDDNDNDGNMIPPHEWIARKLARSQISSFSVYEGVGRTLKGRDLSNVRNAILTKTGFLE